MDAASENLPVAFAALLAGGLLLEHGISTVKTAFAGGTSSASSPASTAVGGPLPAKAAGKLNANQGTFASELSAQTGLDPRVVAAWLLAEEPASASGAPNGANNWLNIGATDSGFYGAGNPAWADPVSAADFTAQWLHGHTAPGFGVASSGIQHILSAAGQSAQTQISAIQNSGWASGGYPSLPTIYQGLL